VNIRNSLLNLSELVALSIRSTEDFKDEMRDFKDEMRGFKDEMNEKWGNLANSLGFVVEGLLIPNIEPLIDRVFNEKIEDIYQRITKRSVDRSRSKEFDAIIATKSYVFLFEVKTSMSKEYADKLKDFIESNSLFDFFPDYRDRKVIPVMGSVDLKPHQIKLLTERNILAISIKGDILSFRNLDQVKKKLMLPIE